MDEKNRAQELLNGQLKVVNIGLDIFLSGLKSKDISVLQVDWRPPAKGNAKLLEALRKISK